MWGQIFIFIAAILCLYFVFKHLTDKIKDIKYVVSAALVLWILMQIFAAVDIPYRQRITDIIHISSLSFVLVALLLIIRNLRPSIFRYPYLLSFAPVLIPFAKILVIDTHLVKDIILLSTQGVAIVVFALLMLTSKLDISAYMSIIMCLLLLVITYTMAWILPDFFELYDYIWQILLSTGMILGTYTFTKNIESNLIQDI